MTRKAKTLWLVVSLAFLGIVLLIGAVCIPVLLVMPPKFEAVCRIRVIPARSPASSAPQPVSEKVLVEERRRIESTSTMTALVEKLNLTGYYAKRFRLNDPMYMPQAAAVAASHVNIRSGSEPGILEIRVTEEDPQMAADMANELAAIHVLLLKSSGALLESMIVVRASVPLRPIRWYMRPSRLGMEREAWRSVSSPP